MEGVGREGGYWPGPGLNLLGRECIGNGSGMGAGLAELASNSRCSWSNKTQKSPSTQASPLSPQYFSHALPVVRIWRIFWTLLGHLSLSFSHQKSYQIVFL